MFITTSFKKSLIVEQLQGNYLNRVNMAFSLQHYDNVSKSEPLNIQAVLQWPKKEIFSRNVQTITLSNKFSLFNNKLILPTPCENLWLSGPLAIVNTVGEAARRGLSSTLTVKCTHCGDLNNVNTSGQHRAGSRGPLASDVNTRAVLGSLHIGIGQTELNNCSLHKCSSSE